MKTGDVVIVSTGQAGTIILNSADQFQVLLRNGEIWTGPSAQCRLPQDEADLAAAPIDVERPRPKKRL